MGTTFREMGWQDKLVKVKREELLTALKENRKRHIEQYAEACMGYRQAALDRIRKTFDDLQLKVSAFQGSRPIEALYVNIQMPIPVSHERAYNQIIRMMEMEVEAVVELTASQFGCFVMDDWDWKQDWNTSNAPYFGGVKAAWVKGTGE